MRSRVLSIFIFCSNIVFTLAIFSIIFNPFSAWSVCSLSHGFLFLAWMVSACFSGVLHVWYSAFWFFTVFSRVQFKTVLSYTLVTIYSRCIYPGLLVAKINQDWFSDSKEHIAHISTRIIQQGPKLSFKLDLINLPIIKARSLLV